jgi:hypothetical protein
MISGKGVAAVVLLLGFLAVLSAVAERLTKTGNPAPLEFISDRVRLGYIKSPAEVVDTNDLAPAESSLLTRDSDFVHVKETPDYIVLTEKWTPGSRQGLQAKYGRSTNDVIMEKLTPRFAEIGKHADLTLESHNIVAGNSVVVYKKPAASPKIAPVVSGIGKLKEYKGKAYRVDIENWGIPRDATVADIIRFEREELKNVYPVSDALMRELDKYSYRDAVWVTKEKEDAMDYLSEGMTEADISEMSLGAGAKIVAEDGQGGYLVLYGSAKPKPISVKI